MPDLWQGVAEEYRSEHESVQNGSEGGYWMSTEAEGEQNRVDYFPHGGNVDCGCGVDRYDELLAACCWLSPWGRLLAMWLRDVQLKTSPSLV